MELITYRFNEFHQKLKIVNIGDVHYGNVQCDRQSFEKIVEYVKQNDNVYWISTGDILEVALKDSVSFDYKAMSLQQELNEVIEILTPIRGKCLGIVGSNHHERLERQSGLNLDHILSEMLDVVYLGYAGFLRVVLGNAGYFLCLHHGVGASKTRGAKTNNLERIGNIFKGFDIYLMGHTHCYEHFINNEIILDKKHYKLANKHTHYITTGHYLNYDDSYAEKKLYNPAPKGSAEISLYYDNSNKKQIEVNFIGVE